MGNNSPANGDFLPDSEVPISDYVSSEVGDRVTLQRTPQEKSPKQGRSRKKRDNVTATGSEVAASPRQSKRQRSSRSNGKASGNDEEDVDRVVTKQAHSVIERKYRNNLNTKMLQLHHTLAATNRTSSTDDNDPQPRKSEILSNALQYINESEVEIRHMSDEILRLENKIKVLEKKVKCNDCTVMKHIVAMKMR